MSPVSPIEPISGNLNFQQYLREQDSKILEKIVIGEKVQGSQNGSDGVKSPSPIDPDEPFFTSLDNDIRQFVTQIQRLKAAKDSGAKQEFVSLAGGIFSRIDTLVDQIVEYYLFKNVAEDYSLVEGQRPLKKALYAFKTVCINTAETIIQKSKIASGVWPPPEAAEEMIQSTIPCVTALKKYMTFIKEAAKIIRKTEDASRQKMERWMNDWNQSAQVRALFTQFEQLQLHPPKVLFYVSS